MIHREEQLDPNALDKMPEEQRRVLDGAQHAGHGPRHMNLEHASSGSLEQVIIPSSLIACGDSVLEGGSDFSEGCSTMREMFEEIAEEMTHEGVVD